VDEPDFAIYQSVSFMAILLISMQTVAFGNGSWSGGNCKPRVSTLSDAASSEALKGATTVRVTGDQDSELRSRLSRRRDGRC